jgi:hypothetical protein
MKQVTIVELDDWMGLYIDGELYDETHRFNMKDFITILQRTGYHKLQYLDMRDTEFEHQASDSGCLPTYLEEVQ